MESVESILSPILELFAAYALPLIMGIILVELILLWISKKVKRRKESWISLLSYGFGALPYFVFFNALQLAIMMWFYNHIRFFTLGAEWYVWVIALVAFDLVWWLVHFMAHKVRFFWCIHGVHHSPKEMNMSVSIRGSLFDFVQYIHLMIWLPIFGFHPYMIFLCDMIHRLWAVFTHLNETKLKNTPLADKVLITPSLHRVHHSSNAVYVDTNFSNMFSFWDQLFGTHQRELKSEKPIFGITGNDRLNTEKILSTQFSLFGDLISDIRQTPHWRDKIKYLFMPPGWHPSGTSITAKKFREEARLKHRVSS